MTRKDYVRIARAFAASRPSRYVLGDHAPRYQWEQSLIEVARELKADNGRFDAERFVRAAHEGDTAAGSEDFLRLSRKFNAAVTTFGQAALTHDERCR